MSRAKSKNKTGTKSKAGVSLFNSFMNYFFGGDGNIFGHTKISKPEKNYRSKNSTPHQSNREKARRRAQMDRGMHRECRAVRP